MQNSFSLYNMPRWIRYYCLFNTLGSHRSSCPQELELQDFQPIINQLMRSTVKDIHYYVSAKCILIL